MLKMFKKIIAVPTPDIEEPAAKRVKPSLFKRIDTIDNIPSSFSAHPGLVRAVETLNTHTWTPEEILALGREEMARCKAEDERLTAIEDGRKECFEIGFKEGFEIGFKEGFEIGFKKGFEIGVAKTKWNIFKRMKLFDYSDDIIKQCLSLTDEAFVEFLSRARSESIVKSGSTSSEDI